MDEMIYHKNWIIGSVIISGKIMVMKHGQETCEIMSWQHD